MEPSRAPPPRQKPNQSKFITTDSKMQIGNKHQERNWELDQHNRQLHPPPPTPSATLFSFHSYWNDFFFSLLLLLIVSVGVGNTEDNNSTADGWKIGSNGRAESRPAPDGYWGKDRTDWANHRHRLSVNSRRPGLKMLHLNRGFSS